MSYQQYAPRTAPREPRPYEREIAGIPPVPEYDETQPPGREGLVAVAGCAAIFLFLTLVAGILLLLLRLPFSGQVFSPRPAPSQAQSPVIAPTSPSCPDANLSTSTQQLALDFCSPKYNGNVAGPVGSRITLIGKNFPSTDASAVHWLLFKSDISNQNQLDRERLRNCFSRALPEICFSLQPPSLYQLRPDTTLFSWTWTPASGFPARAGNYFLVARVGVAGDSPLVVSSVSFTLLTSESPCISIVQGQSQTSDCPSPASVSPLYLSQGTLITITGSNWQLWGKKVQPPVSESVTITARCASEQSCSEQQLFQTTVPVDIQGTFKVSLSLPPHVTGTYDVVAVNSAPQIATPEADPYKSTNTIINGTLTFGEKATGHTLRLMVT